MLGQGGYATLESIGSYLVTAAGVVGMGLGAYGLAPFVFRGRVRAILSTLTPQEADIVQQEMALAEAERERAEAFGVLVTSRRDRLAREGYLLDLPAPVDVQALPEESPVEADVAGWEEALPEMEVEPVLDLLREEALDLEETEPSGPAIEILSEVPERLPLVQFVPPPSAADPLPALRESPEDIETEVLEIFRDLPPVEGRAQPRRRPVAVHATAGAEGGRIEIADLLADARWTVRGLRKPRARGVRQRD